MATLLSRLPVCRTLLRIALGKTRLWPMVTDKGNGTSNLTADQRADIELKLYRLVQIERFPEDYTALKHNRKLPSNSKLQQLAPEFDRSCELIRVGGRLRRSDDLPNDTRHPIVLDPSHHVVKLLIKDYDISLKHYGSERIFAEMRRKFWVLRGREAIRMHQHRCFDCRKWRAKPQVPKMADLPPARLRLFKPPFYSTGMDCFGPMLVKIDRRTEKRWGIIFKCMTTRAIHLDLLNHMDTDAFLMALRRFTARRMSYFLTVGPISRVAATNFRRHSAPWNLL